MKQLQELQSYIKYSNIQVTTAFIFLLIYTFLQNFIKRLKGDLIPRTAKHFGFNLSEQVIKCLPSKLMHKADGNLTLNVELKNKILSAIGYKHVKATANNRKASGK